MAAALLTLFAAEYTAPHSLPCETFPLEAALIFYKDQRIRTMKKTVWILARALVQPSCLFGGRIETSASRCLYSEHSKERLYH